MCSKPGGGTSQYLQVLFFLVLLGEWLKPEEWQNKSSQKGRQNFSLSGSIFTIKACRCRSARVLVLQLYHHWPVLLVVPGGAPAVPALPVSAAASLLSAAAPSVFAPAAMFVASTRRTTATPLFVSFSFSLCETSDTCYISTNTYI